MPAPTPDLKSIKQFLKYKKMKLTYREIEKLMGKQLRTLTRWNRYVVDNKLSTVSFD